MLSQKKETSSFFSLIILTISCLFAALSYNKLTSKGQVRPETLQKKHISNRNTLRWNNNNNNNNNSNNNKNKQQLLRPEKN